MAREDDVRDDGRLRSDVGDHAGGGSDVRPEGRGRDDVRGDAGGRDDVRDDAGGHADVRGAGATPEGGPGAVSGPAPIVDLGDNAVPVRPAKPLGPRRLARLQRELEARSRELAGTGTDAADRELLAKQLRFAELTAQAEAANAGATGEVQAAAPGPAPRQPSAPRHAAGPSESEPSESGPADPVPGRPAEQITVVFPGSGDPEALDGPDPVHVDPALFSNRLAPEELAALTHIEIVPAGGPESREQRTVPPAEAAAPPAHLSAPQAEASARTAEDTVAPPADPASPTGDRAPQASPPATAEDVAPAPPEPVPPAPVPSVPGDAEPPAPAAPVSAARAEGLELLDPKEYRRRSGPAWAILVLSLVAALILVVVLFVL